MKEHFRKVHDFARNKLNLSSDLLKVRFDQKTKQMNFEESNAVCFFQLLEGPYLVIETNGLVCRIRLSSKDYFLLIMVEIYYAME